MDAYDRLHAIVASGIELKIKVEGSIRTASANALRWVKQYGSMERLVAQFPHFNKKGYAWNRLESEVWVRSLDLEMNDDGWKTFKKNKRTEVEVKRLFALYNSSSGNP